jgi:hypothetical protein
MSLLTPTTPGGKFPTIGSEVAGTVTEDPAERQQTDFDSGELLYWKDGKPRMQLVVKVSTEVIDPTIDSDDGIRALYVKGDMLRAVRQALAPYRRAEIKTGDFLAVRYVADKPLPPGQRGFPQKVYEARFTPGDGTPASAPGYVPVAQAVGAPVATFGGAPIVPVPLTADQQAALQQAEAFRQWQASQVAAGQAPPF